MSTDTNILTTDAPYVFDHIPTLHDLLPKTAGIPGVEYAQICTTNAKYAQDEGWGAVEGAKFYSIEGPKGTASMVLACKGTPIRGASPSDGARRCYLDEDIAALTGLPTDGSAPDHSEKAEVPSEPASVSPKPKANATSEGKIKPITVA